VVVVSLFPDHRGSVRFFAVLFLSVVFEKERDARICPFRFRESPEGL
jgi:hypothetical protein